MISFTTVTKNRTLYIPFATEAIDGTRLGFSNPVDTNDFRIYKENDAAQRASLSGTTILETFDLKTGIHLYTIDLFDDDDAGFFEEGKDYWVIFYPSSELVDGRLTSKVLASFRIVAAPIRGFRTDKPSRKDLERKIDSLTVEVSTIKNILRQNREEGDNDGTNS